MALSSPAPVAEAVRERRLIWLGDPEELARRYPRTAIALPYHHAMTAAPILTGTAVWGALLLFWPGSDTAGTAYPMPERVRAAGRRLGRFLHNAADTGHAVIPGPVPRSLPQPPARKQGPAEAPAAADFVERLPEGCCSLDLEGRFTYVSATAAALLGSSVADLIGTRPWQSLPWCTDPAFEDHYRATVVSRKPSRYTALHPPDRWLTYELYPDASGVSVRISPTDPVGAPQTVPARKGAPRVSRSSWARSTGCCTWPPPSPKPGAWATWSIWSPRRCCPPSGPGP